MPVVRNPRLLGALALLVSFGAMVNIQYNSVLLAERGLSPRSIGLLTGLGNLTSLASPLLAGWWSDRSGHPRRILSLYGGISALLLAALPHLAPGAGLWIGFLLFQAAFLPISSLSQALVITRATGPQGGFLALRAMGTLGFFLLSLVFARWIGPGRLPWAYATMALCLLVSLPLYALLPPPAREPASPTEKPLRLAEVVGYLWRRDLRGAYAGGALGYFAYAMAGAMFGNYVEGPLGGDHADVSLAWSVATGCELALMFAAIPFVRRFGLRSLLLLGLGSMVVRYAWTAVAPGFAGLLGAQTLHGLMVAGLLTGQNLYIARRLPPDRVSSGTAAAALLNGGLASALGSLAAGLTWAEAGPRWVYATSALVALAALLWFWKDAPEP